MNLDLLATPQQVLLCGAVREARAAARGPGAYVSRKLLLQSICYAQPHGLHSGIEFVLMPWGPDSAQVLADLALLEHEGALENRSLQPESYHDYHLGVAGLSLVTKNADWLAQAAPKLAPVWECLQPFKKKHLATVAGLHFVFLTLQQFGNAGPYRERCVDEVLAAEPRAGLDYREYLIQTYDAMVRCRLTQP